MNLLQERISQCCQRLKLPRIAAEWPALADEAVKRQASLGDFLEKILTAECEARDQRSREVLLKLATLPCRISCDRTRPISWDWYHLIS